MKKTLILLLATLVVVGVGVVSYSVGYVNGSDDSFLFDAAVELSSGVAYLKIAEKADFETIKTLIKSDLEAGVAKVTDTSEGRTFPVEHFRRYSFLSEAGVGGQVWSEKAKEYQEKANAILKKENSP